MRAKGHLDAFFFYQGKSVMLHGWWGGQHWGPGLHISSSNPLCRPPPLFGSSSLWNRHCLHLSGFLLVLEKNTFLTFIQLFSRIHTEQLQSLGGEKAVVRTPSGGRSSSWIMDWRQASSGYFCGSISSGAVFMNMGILLNSCVRQQYILVLPDTSKAKAGNADTNMDTLILLTSEGSIQSRRLTIINL